jgi:DNA repair protein RecN (Recombination protein N)
LQGDDGAVLDRLGAVQRALANVQRIDPSLERLQASSDAAYYALDELARELAAYADGVEADPLRLREVDARRALLHQLLRKHGPTVADVLATAEQARAELALVDDIESARASVERGLREAIEAHRVACEVLTRLRTAAAATLAQAVTALLPELGMVDGRFLVQLTPLGEAGAYGAEQVQFLVTLNAGTMPGALDRVASGGELARVMLAVSTVLARLQAVPTLVFDEVDAGVGGAVAWQVGALMRRVAAHHQVLAISHLAQIAACAHHHVVVRKARTDGFTTSDTETVQDEARVLELARMLGGDADREVSRAHARELLARGAAISEAIGDEEPTATAKGRQRRGKPR